MKEYQSISEFAADLPVLCAARGEALKGHDGRFLISVSGGKRWAVTLKDGTAEVSETAAGPFDCEIVAEERTLLDLIRGRLNPVKALLFRKVTVHGDVMKLKDLIAALR